MDGFREKVKERFEQVARRNSLASIHGEIDFKSADSSDLTAISLLIISFGVVCLFLYLFACILVPFFLAVFLMYLFQPVVHILTKPPIRCINKCRYTHGEACFESCFRLTASRQPLGSFEMMDEGSMQLK
ncbi:unnamed protein product, partial [Heterosigma akashiwo]